MVGCTFSIDYLPTSVTSLAKVDVDGGVVFVLGSLRFSINLPNKAAGDLSRRYL